MKQLISIVVLFFTLSIYAQQEFHVFPINGEEKQGKPSGDGSMENPWDLQTALSQSSDRVNGGDFIWIHEGIYNGFFKSFIKSTLDNKYIMVSAFRNDKVVINGNTKARKKAILEVNGGQVIYKNFTITYLGNFSRNESDKNFKAVVGINHLKGKDCKFQNLIIYNIPGSGIGSWKATGSTIIENCIIYNNGYQGVRGHGVGIYVQNQNTKIRQIRNNIIFNHYYKGIEVWSATIGTKKEFVKNVNLENNIIFNNGSPSGKHVDNLIIASKDTDGINVAKDISVKNNILYHNVDFDDNKNYGHAPSLTLGYNRKALVQNILIDGNIIIGQNNALNILHAKSVEFSNNLVYSGYIHFGKSKLLGLKSDLIYFDDNDFYTRKLAGFRILNHKDYKLTDWQKNYNIDKNSKWNQLKGFKNKPILKLQQLKTNSNHFNVVLIDKNGNNVTVNFNKDDIEEGMIYKIYDIENRSVVIKSGEVPNDLKIEFPMGLKQFEMPLHNTIATKSADNFGVYRIEFSEKEKRKTFFGRLFGWLF